MAYTQPAVQTFSPAKNGVSKPPTFQKTKSISYGVSDQIYSASATVRTTAPSDIIPQVIELTNNGAVPLNILVGYDTYSGETVDLGVTKYLHIMLMPGEVYHPSVRAVISTEAASTQFDGTALSNVAPNPAELVVSGATVDATYGAFHSNDASTRVNITEWTSPSNCGANLFRVGDLIRCQNEILEVTDIGDSSDLENNYLDVIRGVHGSGAATHADAQTLDFPFFNAYHDFDRYSVAQTDSNGRFKCTNFFGVGRAVSGVQGIVPGSVAIKFYTAGYQELGLSGITSSTNSGLTAGDEYKFNITVDGGSLHDNLAFTVDSSNTNFGGTSGIISLIQSALDTQYYTAGNLLEKKVTVGIVNGDIRFTSGQRLEASAILLADPTSGTTPFGVGRIPDIGVSAGNPRMSAAVAAKLPDDVTYDRITYATSPNTPVFGYDNGLGRLFGMCNGDINYETGEIDMTGCPANAEFVYTVAHSSGFSGKLNTGANAIVEILANTPSQKAAGSVKVKVY